jgi:hypothetical protein
VRITFSFRFQRLLRRNAGANRQRLAGTQSCDSGDSRPAASSMDASRKSKCSACLPSTGVAGASVTFARSVGKQALLPQRVRRGVSTGSNKEVSVEISDEGIQSADSASRDEWSHFSKYSESKNAFIVYKGDCIYVILPKRAFDIDGVDRFRMLIEAKLPRS